MTFHEDQQSWSQATVHFYCSTKTVYRNVSYLGEACSHVAAVPFHSESKHYQASDMRVTETPTSGQQIRSVMKSGMGVTCNSQDLKCLDQIRNWSSSRSSTVTLSYYSARNQAFSLVPWSVGWRWISGWLLESSGKTVSASEPYSICDPSEHNKMALLKKFMQSFVKQIYFSNVHRDITTSVSTMYRTYIDLLGHKSQSYNEKLNGIQYWSTFVSSIIAPGCELIIDTNFGRWRTNGLCKRAKSIETSPTKVLIKHIINLHTIFELEKKNIWIIIIRLHCATA